MAEYLANQVAEFKKNHLNPLNNATDAAIKLEIFNELCEFQKKFDAHLEQNKDQINKFYSNLEKLKPFKNKKAYLKNISCAYLAAFENQIATLKYLLTIGTNPNIAKINGSTALYVAQERNYWECFNILLNHSEINPNPISIETGCIPLFSAASKGNLEQVTALLAHAKINPNHIMKNGDRILHYAISGKNIECVNVILPYVVDPNTANNDGVTPFHLAADAGFIEGINLFLQTLKIDPTVTTQKGTTALCFAARSGHLDILKTLLPYMDPSLGNDAGFTPFLLAVEYGHIDCVNLLLPHANPYLINKEGKGPIYYAAQNGHTECLQAVLDHIDFNQVQENVSLALYQACQNGNLNCAKLLLERDIDPNYTVQASVKVLLKEAYKKGRQAAVENLLQLNTFFDKLIVNTFGLTEDFVEDSQNKKIVDGFSTLHAAVFFGHVEIVKLLIENGADLNSKAQGCTSLDFAKAMKNYKMIKILEVAAQDNKKINRVIEFFVKHKTFFAAPFNEQHRQNHLLAATVSKLDEASIATHAEILRALDDNQQVSFFKNKEDYKKIICDLKNNSQDIKPLFKFLKKNPALVEVILNLMNNSFNDKMFMSIEPKSMRK